MRKILDFNEWLGELPHRYKVVVPGNHDRAFHKDPSLRAKMTNATLLIKEGVRICGLNIWGSDRSSTTILLPEEY